MRDARYLRAQAEFCLEMARQMSDRHASLKSSKRKRPATTPRPLCGRNVDVRPFNCKLSNAFAVVRLGRAADDLREPRTGPAALHKEIVGVAKGSKPAVDRFLTVFNAYCCA